MLSELQQELRKLGDEEIARNLLRFFKTGKGQYGEGDQFLGIKVPVLRAFVKTHRNISLKEATSLLRSSMHEERLVALFILVEIFKRSDEKTRQAVYETYLGNTRFINNWDLVDSSAEHIVGAWLRQKDRSPLYELARSKNLWERRISIMATFHFIKHGDFGDTLKIAEILLGDKEDLIHKAVGWMLREIGNRGMATEEVFLQKHHKVMPRTMLRYAIEKFPEEKRLSYLLKS